MEGGHNGHSFHLYDVRFQLSKRGQGRGLYSPTPTPVYAINTETAFPEMSETQIGQILCGRKKILSDKRFRTYTRMENAWHMQYHRKRPVFVWRDITHGAKPHLFRG
ncbi:hypothetical protein TNCV_3433671 [Trichonephila clavipes]|nr:hypothetical protein TNCV_3433671 [Trichonephila clavipes]